jgi:cupin 2 domain-containing protein
VTNLFDGLPARRPDELVEVLAQAPVVRIERIVSTGQATPPGQWFDQDRAEWVVVLQGRAELRFEDETGVRTMEPGDHVTIAPHRRHRVEWTDPDRPTVWLAVHY